MNSILVKNESNKIIQMKNFECFFFLKTLHIHRYDGDFINFSHNFPIKLFFQNRFCHRSDHFQGNKHLSFILIIIIIIISLIGFATSNQPTNQQMKKNDMFGNEWCCRNLNR